MVSTAVGISGSESGVLNIVDVHAGYGSVIVLNGITMRVEPGEVRAVFGANGVGKTTLLSVASGLVTTKSGAVYINGDEVTDWDTVARVKAGLCLIPENRRGVFRGLTVRENLVMQRPRWVKGERLESSLEMFPALMGKAQRVVGSLSGGEQQMVALLRAYVSGAKILLLDELSMGLAPKVVDQVFESVRQIAAQNVAVLIVEQFVGKVLAFCDYAYVLSKGKAVMEGKAEDLTRERIAAGYFGSGA